MVLLDKVHIQPEPRAIAGDCFQGNENSLEMLGIHLTMNRHY